eukprot:jgi/Tetstr1/457172/TSEL_043822.t1
MQRAESGYEAVRPVSRVHGLFPLSTDLTNEDLKQDDRRLPAQEEYLWMSCFGAHMAALFVALDELLPYVPATNQDFTPYLARARNHAEAIDKAFRFRLAFLRKLNEIKRRLQLQVAGAGEDMAADVDVAAKDAFGSDELGQRTLDLLSSSLSAQTLKSYAGRLSQFAEFCHDSENISPLEATNATVVRYVAWIGERGHIAAKSLQPYLSAINTFFELHNLVPIAKDSLHLTSARRGLMLRQRRLDAAPLRVPLPADVAYRFVSKAELIVSAPYPESHLDYRALLASVVNFLFFARGLTGVSSRVQDVHVDTYNITLQIYREKGRAGRRGPGDLRAISELPRVPGDGPRDLLRLRKLPHSFVRPWRRLLAGADGLEDPRLRSSTNDTCSSMRDHYSFCTTRGAIPMPAKFGLLQGYIYHCTIDMALAPSTIVPLPDAWRPSPTGIADTSRTCASRRASCGEPMQGRGHRLPHLRSGTPDHSPRLVALTCDYHVSGSGAVSVLRGAQRAVRVLFRAKLGCR